MKEERESENWKQRRETQGSETKGGNKERRERENWKQRRETKEVINNK
jgi:hypothetical protein